MFQILLVEDDPQIREVLSDYMDEKGKNQFQLTTAENGEKAKQALNEKAFDLVLLDVMLPDVDGFTLCRFIRSGHIISETKPIVPIIFLTAKGSEQDILWGYGLGCDDYVVKPFSLATLYVKMIAILRRAGQANLASSTEQASGDISGILCVGQIKLNKVTCQVFVLEQTEIFLQTKQYEILRYLMEHQNQVITRDAMLNAIWGYDYMGTDRIVDNQIKLLRKSLGAAGKQIKTVISKGYKIMEE